MTHDKDFEAWASAGVKKDITLEMLNEKGEAVKRYKISKAHVTEYQPMPDLDANANAVSIDT